MAYPYEDNYHYDQPIELIKEEIAYMMNRHHMSYKDAEREVLVHCSETAAAAYLESL